MALDPCPPWTRWELLWAWVWTAVVIYSAWTISSRAERDEAYQAFERSQKAR